MHTPDDYVDQFSSLLSLHPEYALIFHECQQAGVSSPPGATFPAMNGNSNCNNSQSADDNTTSCDSHVMSRRTVSLQQDSHPTVRVCTPLRPRSKEICNIHS